MNWKPEFSRQQRGETNCGQHCVAMICHIPKAVVEAQLKTRRGTTQTQIYGVLRWFGQDAKPYTKAKFWEQVPDLAIVHTANHWTLHFKGIIYDSCLGIMPVENYPRRVKGYIEVSIPR